MAMAGAQEPSSSNSRCSRYDVFLSFGEDTRKTFTDHLYTALVHAGFRTFRDDDGIERGENIKLELHKAIRESRISIVVFSKDYASSSWCLDELVMILKRKRTSGLGVLPVFYHVDPSHVRKQMGSFKEAFTSHEERLEAEVGENKDEWKDKVEGWRAALKEAAELAGMNLRNQADGHESKFIQKIVKVIGDKLNRSFLHVAFYPIGIESRVQKINSWLQDESDNVGMAVINGMGGIGKTTIAKYVYNLNSERFEGSSFLANIREMSEPPDGLVNLQRQLLSHILKRKEGKISSVDEGINKIKNVIGCKRVVVVLDDVDEREQFNAIIGMCDYFHPESKIILTTRNKNLLKPHEVHKIYEVEKFDYYESFEFFSWHAFGKDHPIEGYIEHSEKVVRHCGGLPLALEVLGNSLSRQSLHVWENALQKLAAIPDSQILKKLKISFDALQDVHDKNVFLHIACFFIGKGKDFTIRILDGCDFHSTVGIQNLVDRCLLTINEQNKLMMHQLLRDMGREIVLQESPEELGKRSRLWHHKDSFNVLRDKTGTEKIEGLYLDLHVLEKDRRFNRTFDVSNVKRPHFDELCDGSLFAHQGNSLKRRCLSLLNWLPINDVVRNSNQIELKTDAFARMQNLRLLQLNHVEIKGRYKDFPKRLRWLSWRGFPLNTIPSDFSLENLVALDLRCSNLKHVWKGTKLLESLKILNLSHSHGLTNTPNFTGLHNLEDLILKNCINLVEVHESIKELGRLVLLNLKGCKNLKKLPNEIIHLTSLENLILSGCSKLDQLPIELGKMKSLTVFHADGITINGISITTGEVKSWSFPLVLKPRKSPESIYFSLAHLPGSLVSLSLSSCNLSINDLAKSLGSFCSLRDLDLSENPFCSLPESIKGLTRLQSLVLSDCERLQSLPELPMSLDSLDVYGCRLLKKVTNLPNLFTHLELFMLDCEKLVEVQGMFKLEPIANADAEIIRDLDLFKLESMGSLEVELSNNMERTRRKYPLQGLYECGIYSIFLPETWVPGWCNNKRRGSLISFKVPSCTNLKIRALNIYVHYTNDMSLTWDFFWYDIRITIRNKTKHLEWKYFPTFQCNLTVDKDVVWLSHWKIAHQLMEGGDAVDVQVGYMGLDYEAEEVGVHILYDEHNEKGGQRDVVDLLPYRDWSDSYFLCHYFYEHLQESRRRETTGFMNEKCSKEVEDDEEWSTYEEWIDQADASNG